VKYTFLGLDQKTAFEYGLKANDCLILKWAKEIFGLSSCFSFEKNKKPYYWLKVDQLLEDYPILQITKASVLKKLKSYEHQGYFLKTSETTPLGTFGYYSPTAKFDSLFDNRHHSEKITSGKDASSLVFHSEKIPTGSEKITTGSEKITTGSEKIPAIPSLYNLTTNNPPPITLNATAKREEEESFDYLSKKLDYYGDKEELQELSGKHGLVSLKYYYAQAQKDVKSGTVRTIGVLVKRLKNGDRYVPKVKAVSKVLESSSCGNVLENTDVKNKLGSGFLSASLNN